MSLVEHHAALRHWHVAFVAASGLLFAIRAVAVIGGARWPLRRPARIASWVVDSALLVAGVLLWAALRLHPLHQPWLGTKLALLLVYIALGTMALRRARTPAARVGWTLAALACFGWIVAVARSRDPLGPLAPLASALGLTG